MTVDPFGTDNGTSDEDKEAAGFLSGSGTVAVKWPDIGATFEGTIESWEMRQQTDKDTGDLKFFVGNKLVNDSEITPDKRRAAKAAMQLLLHCQGPVTGITYEWMGRRFEERPLPDDDGMRTLYVRADMQRAVSKAMKDAGNCPLERGAYIQVKLMRTEKKGDFHKNVFAAKWTPAAQNPKATGDFLAPEQAATPAAADPWAVSAPAPQPVAAAAPAAAPAAAADPWA